MLLTANEFLILFAVRDVLYVRMHVSRPSGELRRMQALQERGLDFDDLDDGVLDERDKASLDDSIGI